ncbi:hypothetical protein Tco_1299730, partial [Tanacetum coccineum]
VDSDFVESLSNRDTLIVYSSKIDPILEEFADELAHIALIPPGIVEADFDPNDDTSNNDDSYEDIEYVDATLPNLELVSLEEAEDVILQTRSGSTTTHANNSLLEYDSFLFEVEPDQGGLTSVVMEEISDNSTNDSLLELPEFESFNFDPSFPRPPPEPPDVEICLNFEPDTAMINNFNELNEDECFDPGGGEIDVSQNVEDDNSFTFVIRTFLPFLTYPMDSPLLLSTGSEDTIFDPGIST